MRHAELITDRILLLEGCELPAAVPCPGGQTVTEMFQADKQVESRRSTGCGAGSS